MGVYINTNKQTCLLTIKSGIFKMKKIAVEIDYVQNPLFVSQV